MNSPFVRCGRTYFNSIKVRLEPGVPLSVVDCSNYFNSIKVRLEQIKEYGAIQTNVNFNSIKVRLEHYSDLSLSLLATISIP